MKFPYQEFNSTEDIIEHFEQETGITLDFDSPSNSFEYQVLENKNKIIIGVISPDSDVEDFFESADGLGEFIEFSSPESRDDKINELKKTKKLFYLVDKYAHGNVHYSISDSKSYPDQRWDVTQGKAIFIPCDEIQSRYKKMKKQSGELLAFKEYIEDSNGILDTYSQWCNGETYGYQVFTFDKTTGKEVEQDSCWGFIGLDNVNEEKRGVMESIYISEQVQELRQNVILNDLTKTMLKNLPFKVLQKGFSKGSIVQLKDKIAVSILYEEEDKAHFYEYDGNKASLNKFEPWLKNHGTTPEKFLNANIDSFINTEIKNELLNNQQSNTLRKKI